VKLWCP